MQHVNREVLELFGVDESVSILIRDGKARSDLLVREDQSAVAQERGELLLVQRSIIVRIKAEESFDQTRSKLIQRDLGALRAR